MGFNGEITRGSIDIPLKHWGRAHAAILALDGAGSIDHHPANYDAYDEGIPLVRRTVRIPQRVIESDDLIDALTNWDAFPLDGIPDWEPEEIEWRYMTNIGRIWIVRDHWRRILRDEELVHAIAPYVTKGWLQYKGDDRTEWGFQFEDGVAWEYTKAGRGQPWRRRGMVKMRELVRPVKINFGWTKITSHEIGANGERVVVQYEVNLDTGERREWSDPAMAKLPKIIVR